jgi:transposase
VVTDGKGTPLIAQLTPGQQHESTCVESLLDAFQIPQSLGRPRSRPEQLAGDKAYSIPRIRQFLRDRGIRAVIPHKENERASRDGRVRFDKVAYRQRCVIEQCVGWLKECRRIGTRFDKLAVNYHGMVTLAMIGRYLKLLFSDRA